MMDSIGLNAPTVSKINWTQGISFLAMMLTMFGIDLDTGTQSAIVATIGGLTTILTFVLRTWFTGNSG